LTSRNYDAAVVLLKERYGDPQNIISAHVDALVNLPGVVNSRDLKGVRQLYDEVEANVRGLSARPRCRGIWRAVASLAISQNLQGNKVEHLQQSPKGRIRKQRTF